VSFASPIALLGLLLVPLAAGGYIWFQRRRVEDSARFVAPALLPNVVDRVPSWRRHLPVAIFLLGVAAFLLGFARPHATLSERSEEATVVLAIDTSHSMGANDVRPTRLAAAEASARRFLTDLPKKYRVAVVAFSSRAQLVAPPSTNRQFVNTALAALRVGQGTALGDGIATSVKIATAPPLGSVRPKGQAPPPAAVLVISDGAQDGGRIRLADAVSQARKAKVPVFTAVLGTAAGVLTVPHIGGFVERIQVPPNPTALRNVAAQTGGSFFAAPTQDDLKPVYADLRSRLGKTNKDEEITVAFAAAGALFLLVGGGLSALWFRRVP
jgi:Ca-activated chloride channel family protein